MRFVHHTFFHEITNTFGDSIHTETKDDAFAVDHNTHIDIEITMVEICDAISTITLNHRLWLSQQKARAENNHPSRKTYDTGKTDQNFGL